MKIRSNLGPERPMGGRMNSSSVRNRIGLVASLFCLLASNACSSAPLTESGETGGAPDAAAEGGAVPGVSADGGADSAMPTVHGGGDAGHAKDGSASPPPPPGCDLGKDPKDSSPCVVDGFGAFVDATAGSDANNGTKAHPMKTIQAALAKGLPRVYVCAGTYAEHVKVTNGVGVYGGFSCADWSYAVANVVSIAPADAGYAVEIADVADVVVLEDVSILAQAGTAALPNSVAIFAHGSKLTMKRATAIASDGYVGTSSTVGSNYDQATAPDGLVGAGAGVVAIAGPAPACDAVCKNGAHSTGGRGFGAGGGFGSGTPAMAGGPAIPGVPGGAAGVPASCSGLGAGQDGASGPNGTDAPAPTSIGVLSAAGWAPASGAAGASFGSPAQGGGGGGGSNAANGAGGGGSGACGGCGGAPASAATGGGASIALLSFESTLTLTESILTSGAGGNGGNGSAGQPGQSGGHGGPAFSIGCQGGNGGTGGAGGASAGGAAGLSVGVLYVAKTVKTPVIDGATMNAITPGTAGQRGAGGAPGNDGLAVPAQKVLDAASL